VAIVTTLLKIAGSLVLIFLGIALAPGEEDPSTPSSSDPPDPSKDSDTRPRSEKGLIRIGGSGVLRSRRGSEELAAKCYAAAES